MILMNCILMKLVTDTDYYENNVFSLIKAPIYAQNFAQKIDNRELTSNQKQKLISTLDFDELHTADVTVTDSDYYENNVFSLIKAPTYAQNLTQKIDNRKLTNNQKQKLISTLDFDELHTADVTVTDSDYYENNVFSLIKAPIYAQNFAQKIDNRELTSNQKQKLISTLDFEAENTAPENTFNFSKNTNVALAPFKTSKKDKDIDFVLAKVTYWDTVHSIESKQGKLLYRPRNKSRSCTYTTAPCGHHQLTVRALKDIGCKSLQCRKDRLIYSKSLKMSKKLLAKNENRLKKNGYTKLEDYQRYLIHQQGASGIKVILAATKGEKLLSRRIKKNMANNSPYSYRKLNRMGSRLAAKMFMKHWKNKWKKEKLLVAGVTLASNQTQILDTSKAKNQTSAEPLSLPLFNEHEIQLALNYKF